AGPARWNVTDRIVAEGCRARAGDECSYPRLRLFIYQWSLCNLKLAAFVRRHRRAQGGSPMLRSIRPWTLRQVWSIRFLRTMSENQEDQDSRHQASPAELAPRTLGPSPIGARRDRAA